jgi:hypothetical protein
MHIGSRREMSVRPLVKNQSVCDVSQVTGSKTQGKPYMCLLIFPLFFAPFSQCTALFTPPDPYTLTPPNTAPTLLLSLSAS